MIFVISSQASLPIDNSYAVAAEGINPSASLNIQQNHQPLDITTNSSINSRFITTKILSPISSLAITSTKCTQPLQVNTASLKVLTHSVYVTLPITSPNAYNITINLSISLQTKELVPVYIRSKTVNIMSKPSYLSTDLNFDIHFKSHGFVPEYVPNYLNYRIKPSKEYLESVTSYAFLEIQNLAPDYFANLNPCKDLYGDLPNLTIPVRVGELQNIATFESNIVKIYNKPFGIYIDGNRIYGRLIKTQPITMIVYLESGKVVKVTLEPYMSDFVKLITQ
jgi:hypothetical protein